MNDKCVFFSGDGWCSALVETRCTGYLPEFGCSFYKTEEKYIDDINKSVMLNRKKGNCIQCKYRKVQCQLREKEGTEYDG